MTFLYYFIKQSLIYTKIGTIQRRLAWPLRKDDTQNREAFHIFDLHQRFQLRGKENKNFFPDLARIRTEKSCQEEVAHMSVLDSLVVRISACHVEGPGSIPGRGVFFLEFYAKIIMPRPLFLFSFTL